MKSKLADTKLQHNFKLFYSRYIRGGKSWNLTKLLPEIIFRSMRLEGEKVTRKQTKALFS